MDVVLGFLMKLVDQTTGDVGPSQASSQRHTSSLITELRDKKTT
jgi:hypothetical protein